MATWIQSQTNPHLGDSGRIFHFLPFWVQNGRGATQVKVNLSNSACSNFEMLSNFELALSFRVGSAKAFSLFLGLAPDLSFLASDGAPSV